MNVLDLCQWCRFTVGSTEWNTDKWLTPLVVVTKYGWWTAQVFERVDGELAPKSICGRAAKPASAA